MYVYGFIVLYTIYIHVLYIYIYIHGIYLYLLYTRIYYIRFIFVSYKNANNSFIYAHFLFKVKITNTFFCKWSAAIAL